MPKITVLPHEKNCPEGSILDIKTGTTCVELYSIMALKLNMPVTFQELVPPAMSLFEKALKVCRKWMMLKQTCLIVLGV